MSRYIDVEKIEQVFKSKIPFKYLMASNYDTAVENAFKIVDILNAEIPTADVEEVRHGNWIDVLEYSVYIPDRKTSIVLTEQKCSNCGVVTTFKGDKMYLPDFCCPNCGAKMDGADGE